VDIKGGERRLRDFTTICSLKGQKWTPRILIEGKKGICEWLSRMLKEER